MFSECFLVQLYLLLLIKRMQRIILNKAQLTEINQVDLFDLIILQMCQILAPGK
jgi:hypothetical protein